MALTVNQQSSSQVDKSANINTNLLLKMNTATQSANIEVKMYNRSANPAFLMGIERFLNQMIGTILLSKSYNITWKIIDKGILEMFGPFGMNYFLTIIAQKTNKISGGIIVNIFLLLIGLFIFIWFSV